MQQATIVRLSQQMSRVPTAQLCIIIPLYDLQGQGNLFLNYHFFIFKVLNVGGKVIFFYIFKNWYEIWYYSVKKRQRRWGEGGMEENVERWGEGGMEENVERRGEG